MVFGRNYDWVTGNGIVCTNQRGLTKTSFKTKDGETISWVSLYGSITFNQYGKEFPTGGMNEKGLVVELMWLDGTIYPKADKRPALGVLQWIQYQLDNCSTIDELIATDNKVRIASIATTPLHYLVADAKGNAATIEFLEGRMVVHKGSDLPFPVLTNDKYSSSLEQTASAIAAASTGDLSFANNSIERFAKACNRVKEFQQGASRQRAVEQSFSILAEVAQGSHTKWSIVYDISNKKVYFKSLASPLVKHVAFTDFDMSCHKSSKVYDINSDDKGLVSTLFTDFSIDFNRKIVNRSFDESVSQFNVSEEGRKQTWQYPAGISCEKGVNSD